jgi:hypothetical protein
VGHSGRLCPHVPCVAGACSRGGRQRAVPLRPVVLRPEVVGCGGETRSTTVGEAAGCTVGGRWAMEGGWKMAGGGWQAGGWKMAGGGWQAGGWKRGAGGGAAGAAGVPPPPVSITLLICVAYPPTPTLHPVSD